MNTAKLYDDLKTPLGEEVAKVLSDSFETVNQELASKTELAQIQIEIKNELKELTTSHKQLVQRVDKLEESHKQLVQRVDKLEESHKQLVQRVDKLEESHKQLVQRVDKLEESHKQLVQRVDKLEESHKQLVQRVDKLEESHKQLVQRVDKLEESHKQLVQRVDELTLRVDKLTERVDELAESHKQLARQVGGLSASVGYGIEDQLYPYIPEFVKKVYGIQITNYELRKNIIYEKGKFDEIDIYLEGVLNGEKVFILGECKAQASKNEISNFAKLIERFTNFQEAKVIPFFISYLYSPDIEEYFQTEHPKMNYYKTYQVRSINMDFGFYN